MKLEYDEHEFTFEITKEELVNIPPEKLAQMMIDGIENAIYQDFKDAMIKGLMTNEKYTKL